MGISHCVCAPCGPLYRQAEQALRSHLKSVGVNVEAQLLAQQQRGGGGDADTSSAAVFGGAKSSFASFLDLHGVNDAAAAALSAREEELRAAAGAAAGPALAEFRLRPARPEDVGAVVACVNHAYALENAAAEGVKEHGGDQFAFKTCDRYTEIGQASAAR